MSDDDWSCRAIITLACSERHCGSIYQVCNFKYYGLTNPKNDFFLESGKVQSRGGTKSTFGVWMPRPRKHRYAILLDESLVCNYDEQERPLKSDVISLECCNGTGIVFDKRFGRWYTCPRCTGRLDRIYNVCEGNYNS